MNASKAFLVNNSGMNGGGGAFWDGPSGKVIISLEWNNDGAQKNQDTGIILTPTLGVWSLYQWQFDGIRLTQDAHLMASLTTGFIIFSPVAGVPLPPPGQHPRFGSGQGDPGYGRLNSPNASGFGESFSIPYNSPFNVPDAVSPGFGQSGSPGANCPIAIKETGEVTFSMFDFSEDATPKAARGVLTISPQLPVISFPIVSP